MQSAWPTEAQVASALESQGLTAPDDISIHIGAAIAAWESLTGWPDFLCDDESDPVTYTFDPPQYGTILEPNFGFVVADEVRTGATALTAGRDYRLLPLNAALDNRPYTGIEIFAMPTTRGSVQADLVRGYWTEIDDDVWLAVRDYAMRLAILEMLEGESTASEVRQGPVTLKFDNDEGRSKLDRWDKQFRSLARRYQRIVL